MTNATTIQGTTKVREVVINENLMPQFNTRLTALNKRAEKIGVEPMRFEKTDERTERFCNEYGYIQYRTFIIGNLTGVTPRIEGGWTLLSIIEHTAGGNIITGDDERAEQYRQAEGNCDHCKAKRRRSKTVVVVNEAGEIKQVGLQCMKDFLGYHTNPDSLMDYMSKTGELDDFSGYSAPLYVSAYSMLITAAKIVRNRGYVPSSSMNGTPTTEIADWCWGTLPSNASSREHALRVLEELGDDLEEDAAYAKDCLEWVLSLPENTAGYLGNLRAACNSGTAEKQGLVVSAVQAYAKHLDKMKQQVEREAQVKGAVIAGNGLQITGTVVSFKWVDGYGYNAPDVLKMTVEVEQADGVVRLWGSVPAALEDSIERGIKVSFIANVETSDSADFGFFKRPRKMEVIAA
jgi:hypothetical protein